ncbi:hypothetical protein ACC817_06500 [Rhizobium ruizarguesonis]|uniref:hypothetical protein n=1 Tax=Rhizobium ruizarguesonis TaxID=2081791 RepID=UPI0013EE7DB0|nr:hypothetical protein [Rhizobium ruizarguesonis]
MRNWVDFIGSHLCDAFYLENDIQKLVVADNLCTEPFENIAHIREARFHRQPQLSVSRTRRRGSRYHADSFDRTANGGRRLMERMVEIEQVVMIVQRSSVASGPARPLVIERGIGSDTNHLKVGKFND